MSTPIANDEERAHKLKKAKKHFRFWRGAFIFLCLTAGALTLALNIWLSLQTRSLVKGVLDIGKTNRSNTELLIDCTTPKHACYERGRTSTSAAVDNINKVIIATGYCTDKLGPNLTYPQLEECVTSLVQP